LRGKVKEGERFSSLCRVAEHPEAMNADNVILFIVVTVLFLTVILAPHPRADLRRLGADGG
jgi:hypothetical protein